MNTVANLAIKPKQLATIKKGTIKEIKNVNKDRKKYFIKKG